MRRRSRDVSLPAGRDTVLVSETPSGKGVTLLAYNGKHRVTMTPLEARKVAEALLRAAMDAEEWSDREDQE